MTAARFILGVTLFLAAISAARLARLAPAHRVLTITFALGIAADLARASLFALDTGLLARRALFLAFPAISAWCASAALLGPAMRPRARRAWLLGCVLAWLAFVAATIAIDPPRGSPAAEHLALVSRLASIAVELSVVVAFALRRERPTFTQTIALVLVAGDLGELAGPWAWPSAWKAWELARIQWGGVYAVVAWLQIRRSKWIQGLAQAQ